MELEFKTQIDLTKKAQKLSELPLDRLKKKIASGKGLVLSDWAGIATNPNLDTEAIDDIFDNLDMILTKERETRRGVQMKTHSTTIKIKNMLGRHPSMGEKLLKKELFKSTIGEPSVLRNTSITLELLNQYFTLMVLRSGADYEYHNFKALIRSESKLITQSVLMKWYSQLVEYADWNYNDTSWYAIIEMLLELEDLPEQILYDIASAPDNGDNWEMYREMAATHKNVSDRILSIAFEMTDDEQYLPQSAKDVFMF